jgi:hypothetical protein
MTKSEFSKKNSINILRNNYTKREKLMVAMLMKTTSREYSSCINFPILTLYYKKIIGISSNSDIFSLNNAEDQYENDHIDLYPIESIKEE